MQHNLHSFGAVLDTCLTVKRARTVTSREFQHQFADLSNKLKPGESLTITKHGQPLGFFTKVARTRKAPDYLANLEKLGYSAQAGQKLIDEICDLS
jgi:hypothetical protein